MALAARKLSGPGGAEDFKKVLPETSKLGATGSGMRGRRAHQRIDHDSELQRLKQRGKTRE
jgi:hypothetical protein